METRKQMWRTSMLIFSLMVMIALSGCAGPWQNKVTAGFLGSTSLITTAESTAKLSCDQAVISLDKCTQLRTIYGQIRQGAVASGNTLILAMATADAIQQKTLLDKYNVLMADVQATIKSYIDLYTQLDSAKMRASKYAISPAVLTILINAFTAIVQNIPQIIAAVGSWNLSSVDIAALTASIQAAQAALPVW